MRCPVCVNNHVELTGRKTAKNGHYIKDYQHVGGEVRQAWLKYLCHNCHFNWVLHLNYGRKMIVQMLQDGGKIRAIRFYRIATGEGLYEARKYVEEIENKMNHTYSTEENIT